MKVLLRDAYRRAVPQRWREMFRVLRRWDEHMVIPRATLTFAEDGLFTAHAAPFLDDARFQRAYRAGEATDSWGGSAIRWRAFVACWAGEHAARLPGDFVECGVNRGGLSRCVAEYLDFGRLAKRFFLVDTYAGLVPEQLTPTEQAKGLMETYAYYRDNSADAVTRTFAAFPNVRVVAGKVPDVLPTLPLEQVAYLSLDMNCVLPEQRAAEFFWERMPAGGIILHDDYGFSQHADQRRMLNDFARERGAGVLALPTGQGVIIKPGPAGKVNFSPPSA